MCDRTTYKRNECVFQTYIRVRILSFIPIERSCKDVPKHLMIKLSSCFVIFTFKGKARARDS